VHLLAKLPPGSWAVAMGFGIVSVDLDTIGQRLLSDVLFVLATGTWLLLVARLARFPARAAAESTSPAMLGSVAATAVIGSRFVAGGARVVAAALLVLAVAGLAGLLWPVLKHWGTPTTGTSFLLSVAAQGIAVLAATLAASYRLGWLLVAGGLACLAGLVAYVVVAWRFDVRTIGSGPGDQWVGGGVLAIATLAVAKIAAAAAVVSGFGGWHDPLSATALAIWCLAMVCVIPLVVSEFTRPRLSYHVLRWATVFPLGMYAACSFAVGLDTGIGGITEFGKVMTWVAVAVTATLLVGLARRAYAVVRLR
jgi:tellurite resistance protein TehA-like permease